MFFFLSKTLGTLVVPSNLALILIAIGLFLRWRKRALRLARWSLRLGLGVLIVFSLPVVSQLLLLPLENAYRRPKTLARPPVAIVMLTGVLHPNARKGEFELSQAGDRIVEAVRLAHRYPQAKLLILGGSGALLDSYEEGAVLGRLAEQLGVQKARIVVDITSRNTHENAVVGAKLLSALPAGDALLVTSAFHLPRAMACFEKSAKQKDKRLIAWPVDHRWNAIRHNSFIPRWYGLRLSEQLVNEYVGLVVYWIVGYL